MGDEVNVRGKMLALMLAEPEGVGYLTIRHQDTDFLKKVASRESDVARCKVNDENMPKGWEHA